MKQFYNAVAIVNQVYHLSKVKYKFNHLQYPFFFNNAKQIVYLGFRKQKHFTLRLFPVAIVSTVFFLS